MDTHIETISSTKQTKRRRPKTKALRTELKNRLVSALLTTGTIRDLFQIQADGKTMSAPMTSIFERLSMEKSMSEFANLSNAAIKSSAEGTKLFKIEEQADKTLCMNFDLGTGLATEDAIVYLDNLPIQCTETNLRKRATLYGTVVSVKLPQISRIQRRIGSKKNSGFGFIQFASKTAARRMYKRFAANSRLKRIKHQKKRGTRLNVAKLDVAAENSSLIKVDEDKNNFRVPNAPTRQISAPETLIESLDLSTQQNLSSAVEDSGNETENELFNKSANLSSLTRKAKKRLGKRRTRVRTPKLLSMLMNRIQVYPYKHYRELRDEYLRLQKDNLVNLQNRLKNPKVEFAESVDGDSPPALPYVNYSPTNFERGCDWEEDYFYARTASTSIPPSLNSVDKPEVVVNVEQKNGFSTLKITEEKENETQKSRPEKRKPPRKRKRLSSAGRARRAEKRQKLTLADPLRGANKFLERASRIRNQKLDNLANMNI